jgi:hypothetical protein
VNGLDDDASLGQVDLRALATLLNHAADVRGELRELYRTLPAGDPRLLTAAHINGGLTAAWAAFTLMNENLVKPSWWSHHQRDVLERDDVVSHVDNFMSFSMIGMLLFPASLFENGLRRLVRAIDPSACKRGNDSFQSIYSWLIKRLRQAGWDYPEAIEYLDLLRTVRNLIHTNAEFHPPDGKSRAIRWRRVEYVFVPGVHPRLLDMEFLAELLTELVDLNASVMRADVIGALPAMPL